jgi:hypothetical protein
MDPERIIPHAEKELVRDLFGAVHDGGRGDAENTTVDREAREVQVTLGGGMTEVMALVDDHDARISRRQSPKADGGVAQDLQLDAALGGAGAPLVDQRGRDDRRDPSTLRRRDRGGQRDEGLPGPDRVGEECASVPLEHRYDPPRGPFLSGPEPGGHRYR